MAIELSEQEQLRRQSLKALRDLGIEPYPAARYEVTATAREIAENYDDTKHNYDDVRIAGRIMSRRIMGSASFFELQDHTGRIQVYIRRDDICPEGDPTLYNTVFKKLLDIGDFVGVEGFAFRTNTGELSVHCKRFTVLSKSIRPLPVVKEKDGKTFDAFTDPEIRYRQRYLDLIVNPQVKEVFVKRAKIMATMREFFNSKGYIEVETPILQPIPGAPRRVPSSRTTTRSTSTSTCASPRSCTSRSSSSAVSTASTSSARTSATRAWTARTTPSSPAWRFMSPTRTTAG